MKNKIVKDKNWRRAGVWSSLLAIMATLVIVLGKLGFSQSPVDSLTLPISTVPPTPPGDVAQIAYGNLPLIFEANQGQTDPSVRFLSRGPGYTLFLSPEEAVFNLQLQPSSAAENPTVNYTTLGMRLVDANPRPEITGLKALPTRIHYLRGQDAQRWQTDVPTYAKVLLREVYPGIDLVYYGNQRQLQYDFVVAPDVDPRTIRLAFAGPNEPVRPVLAENGDLLLAVDHGEVRWSKPLIYQDIEGQRHFIEGSFILDEDPTEIGFAVAAYDRTQPLVIDPVLAYSTFLGGVKQDYGTSIAVDRDGHAYVTGTTASINFPTHGAYRGSLTGVKTLDAFVTKLNSTGTDLIYSTYLGGTDDKDDIGYGIALDDSGRAYITGMTASKDFPTVGSTRSLHGGKDAFISILDASGGGLLYSTYWGGAKDDEGRGIALGPNNSGDPLHMIHVTGHTQSTALPTDTNPFPVANAFQPALLGGVDAFVSQINPNNNTLVYSTYLGGAKDDQGAAIAVDRAGNVYITGFTASTNFPVTGSSFATTLGGQRSGFVAKIDPTQPGRKSLVYSAYLGGRGTDSGAAIAVDSQYHAYVTGTTTSSDFPVTSNVVQNKYAGNGDAFVTRIYPTGTALAYSTYLGGSGADSGAGIVVTENSGNVYTYVTGATASTNFPVTLGAFDRDPGSGRTSRAFVAQISEQGDQLLYATHLGGINNANRGAGIAVDVPARTYIGDGFDNPYHVYGVYVTGATSASDFPVTFDAFDPVNDSSEDAFVTKLGVAPVDLRIELNCTPNRGAAFPIDCKMEAYNDAATTSPAPMTTLTALLPANVTLSAFSVSPFGSCRTVLTTLICQAGNSRPLIYGAPFAASFTLKPIRSETINLTARVAAAVNDKNPTNNSTTLNMPVSSFYALSVSRSGAGMGTVISKPAGISCGSTCVEYFAAGETVTLTPTPASGSTFGGWSRDCSGSGACTVSMSQARSVEARFDRGGGVPGKPTTIAPDGAIATNRPTYTWNAVGGATWYRLWVDDAATNGKIVQWYTAAQTNCVGGTGACAITPTISLAPGKATWWVLGWSPSGEGPWSNGRTFTVGDLGGVPGKPTTITPSGAITTNRPTYSWNAVAGATWYQLWVNDSTGNRIATWYTAAQTNCAGGTGTCSIAPAVSLSPGAATWWVQGWNASGYGPWSDGRAFTVPAAGPPAKPTLLAPSGVVTTNQPTYSWNAVGTATWYRLWVNDATGNKIATWYTAAQTNCAGGAGTCSIKPAISLAAGTATWWVQGWNPSGEGPWSDGRAFSVSTP